MNYVGVALDDRFCPATLPPLACKVSAEICASDSSAMAVARLDLNRALEGRFGPEGLPLLACTMFVFCGVCQCRRACDTVCVRERCDAQGSGG